MCLLLLRLPFNDCYVDAGVDLQKEQKWENTRQKGKQNGIRGLLLRGFLLQWFLLLEMKGAGYFIVSAHASFPLEPSRRSLNVIVGGCTICCNKFFCYRNLINLRPKPNNDLH